MEAPERFPEVTSEEDETRPKSGPAPERRSAKRIDVRILSRLAYGNFCFQTVEIQNLSFTGFRAKSSLRLRRHDRVSLDLPKIGLVRGTVAWTADGCLGGAFDRAVDIRKALKP